MANVVVLQSFREREAPPWLARCLQSVRTWCAGRGYRYRFVDDALFDLVPAWYRRKAGARTPVIADLARLKWIERVLAEDDVDVAAWLDADMLVFAPQAFDIRLSGTSVFGCERWLQRDNGSRRVRIHKNVHNAYCAFRRASPLLPFLIDSVERMMGRVDADFIAPQFVGPKLLTSLHNIVGFELEPRAGAISPDLMHALLRHDDNTLARLSAVLDAPLCAANLCASLHADDAGEMDQLINVLTDLKSGLR